MKVVGRQKEERLVKGRMLPDPFRISKDGTNLKKVHENPRKSK
jgi:hypothetical protein